MKLKVGCCSSGCALASTDFPPPIYFVRVAAGCGDKSMALKLVELGTDVNCKDSVGGERCRGLAWLGKGSLQSCATSKSCKALAGSSLQLQRSSPGVANPL